MAEQTEPIRRRVAFKVIKLGMDTKQVVARFEAERQALALMDHPNIAKVLDAGATETGRPYFVMELVKGIKITDYCEQNHLDTKERLELFMQVCHAVQHAHQKGIIHRDIKPSNILVTLHDGVPVPKVIDFGIAKATQQPLTDKTVLTAFQQLIGTPAYMSPEQAELSGLDIDTRTDIYALGVLLYELLVGRPPFEPETLRKAGLDEMRRILRETEPVKPSTKLNQSRAESGKQKAETDRASLRRLLQEVKGDLDWIVMKCLEKDRRRRYETANGLAHDIERHLKSEPVSAGAPGTAYRMGKFIRRHRYGFATSAAILLLLIAGVVMSTWQMMRAKRAEKQAETVATFLKEMLESVTPAEAKGRDTTLMREMLEKAAARIDKELVGEPEVRADLQMTIGRTYLELGQYSKGEAMLRQAQETYRKLYGTEHANYARATLGMGVAASVQGRYTEAESLARQALGINRRLFGSTHTNVVNSLNGVAAVFMGQGRYQEAEPLFREALQACERTLGKEHLGTLMQANNLAALLSQKGDYAEAEPLYRRALAAQERTLGKEHPDTLGSVNNLAALLSRKCDYAGAEPLYRRTLEAQERTLGKEHPHTLISVNNLATLLSDKGDYAEAEPLYRRALEAQERTQGKDHPDTLGGVNNLALLLSRKGDYAEAEPLYRRALEAQERTLGKDHPDTLMSVNNLANLLSRKADSAEAEPLYRRALEARERTQGKDHPDTLDSVNKLANLLSDKGDYAGAEPLYRQALEARERTQGKDHSDTLDSVNKLANLLSRKADYAEAEPLYRRALEAQERTLGKEHPDTLNSVNNLANLLSDKGDYAGAEPLYRQALEARERTQGKEHPDTLGSVNNLAKLFYQKGDYAEAEPLFRRALGARERTLDKEHPDTLDSVNNLAGLLYRKGDYAGAEPLFRRALEARERTLGREHPDTLMSVNNLAGLLYQKGDYGRAEPLCRRALEAQERTLGKEHPDTLMSNLARLLYQKGEYAEAEPLYHRALEGRKKVLPGKHPDVVQSVDNLTKVLAAQGKYAALLQLERRGAMDYLGLPSWVEGRRDWQRDIQLLTQAVEKGPNPYAHLRARAFLYGQQGQWRAAADDLSRSARIAARLSLALGPVLLETGDTNGYNNRRRLMSVASWGEDPETAAEAAMEMSLLPRDSGWTTPAQLAEIAVTRGTNHVRLPYFQLAKGLIEYRQGQFEGAVEWARRSLAASGTNYTTAASAGAVWAMAQQQLKQPDEARKTLAQATQVFETKLPKLASGDLGENWPEWLIARLLLREARELVQKK